MKIFTLCFIVSHILDFGDNKMEPFTVNGDNARIEDFPHSAFLGIRCKDIHGKFIEFWICGSSILNQRVTLTAAHCLHGCSDYTAINVYVGHSEMLAGGDSSAHSFLVHQDYRAEFFANDVALVSLQTPLKFNSNIKRLVLMENPPARDQAIVAGWATVGEENGIHYLKYTTQTVQEKIVCIQEMGALPLGCICTKDSNQSSYPAISDSGSALVVDGYIQIGIVSYKYRDSTSNVIVYTDTSYFYNWILKYANKMICL